MKVVPAMPYVNAKITKEGASTAQKAQVIQWRSRERRQMKSALYQFAYAEQPSRLQARGGPTRVRMHALGEEVRQGPAARLNVPRAEPGPAPGCAASARGLLSCDT